MYIPSATYRVQLHKEFTLRELEEIIDYLHQLGVSTIYASPITRAGSGSTHGYDVTDPHTINPEIGNLDELKSVVQTAHIKGIGWLQDIVPNHMAFHQDNKRLMDALERDALSEFHGYFDINWKHPEFEGKVMVPFLGGELADCIANDEIQVVLTGEGFMVQYHEQQYPLSVTAYRILLSVFVLLAKGDGLPRDLSLLLTGDLQTASFEKWQQHKLAIFGKLTGNNKHHRNIEAWLAIINKDKELLTQLLDVQYYQLCHWQEVNRHINYRRFFTISSLISLRMEAEPVFTDYHKLLHQLYEEGMLQGLRIDHIDGLYDPKGYIDRLRQLFGERCYIVAEKILEENEKLPADWRLQGTSGYEFLSEVSQVLTNRQGGAQLSLLYQSLLPGTQSYSRQMRDNKQMVLDQYMQGEWDNLLRYFHELDLAPEKGHWKEAIGALMAALPVYRIYPAALPLPDNEKLVLEEAIAAAMQAKPDRAREIKHLQQLFCNAEETINDAAVLLFLKRLMQFTGPVMAKGVEDTTFYTYNALIAHNEVGDAPATLGNTLGQFHANMKARQQATPLSLNATATHDTKRGEDARMRLNQLSELPELWEEEVKSWFYINEHLHAIVEGQPAPSRNDEYFIYQSIIGGFPEDHIVTEEWVERLQQFLQKALREAKVKSTWDNPHLTYEQACMDFIYKLFQKDHEFLRHFLPFMKQVNDSAAIASLSQLLMKVTAPGIPDIYQGCELWDYSFVDPDNRRPVDYQKRKEYLRQIQEEAKKDGEAFWAFLRTRRAQGMEKLFLTWKALQFRRNYNEVFLQGTYADLTVNGGDTLAALAFARQWKQHHVLTLVPLHTGRPLPSDAWVELPAGAPNQWTNVLTGETMFASYGRLSLAACWKSFPVALLQATGAPQ